MRNDVGGWADSYQSIARRAQINQSKSENLIEQIFRAIDKRQIKPLDIMPIFDELLLQPVHNKSTAAVDERHKRGGNRNFHYRIREISNVLFGPFFRQLFGVQHRTCSYGAPSGT